MTAWENNHPNTMNLDEIARDVVPSSSCTWGTHSIHLKVPNGTSVDSETRLDVTHEPLLRALIWALAIAVVPMSIWFEGLRVLPPWMGLLLLAIIISSIGQVLIGRIQSGFQNRVREQLRVAKTAVNKHEMMESALIAFWAIRDSRPAFAGRVSWLVSGKSKENHVDEFALRPLQKALALLVGMSSSSAGNGWQMRNYFDQYIKMVEERMDLLGQLWDRSISLPKGLLNLSMNLAITGAIVLLAIRLILIISPA